MAPLILHNVPDDECYVGDDGIRRPYAMIFNAHDGPGNTRVRRAVAETGSFGKSTRRARSKGTPARGRENPTLAAADKLFGDWVSNHAAAHSTSNSASNNPSGNGTTGKTTSSSSITASPSTSNQDEAALAPRSSAAKANHKSPVELILRGYRSSAQQYAAIAHYEALAGRILEDYAREPPSSQRRYKSELRDPALTRRRILSPEERALVNRADGGEHWVKVTFESAEAGNAALFASPQRVLGHFVHAEPYLGFPPAKSEACPDVGTDEPLNFGGGGATQTRRGVVSGLPTTFSSRLLDLAADEQSSQTVDSDTLSQRSERDLTMLDASPLRQSPRPTNTNTDRNTNANANLNASSPAGGQEENSVFCRRIPTARKARLLPAEQALLPQRSVVQRVFNAVPIVKWFSGSMIGNEVPRTEAGEFDWGRASLYWKIIWWFDATFGLFRGDVYSIDKDD